MGSSTSVGSVVPLRLYGAAELGIGLANDLLEAREVIMNAASKLEWYEDEETLQQQIHDAQAKKGPGDLGALIASAGTWVVK